MAEHESDDTRERDRVIDLTRATPKDDPPVAGAQWDELHRRWEVWNEELEAWVTLGEEAGVRKAADDRLLPPLLAREVFHAQEIDPIEKHVIDLDRVAEPAQSVPGAQWNEVKGRWERWDDASQAWVDALAAEHSDSTAP